MRAMHSKKMAADLLDDVTDKELLSFFEKKEAGTFEHRKNIEGEIRKTRIDLCDDDYCVIEQSVTNVNGKNAVSITECLDRAARIEMASILLLQTDHHLVLDSAFDGKKQSCIERKNMSPLELIGDYSTALVRNRRLGDRSEMLGLIKMFLERSEDKEMVDLLLKTVVNWAFENGEIDFQEKAANAFTQRFGEQPVQCLGSNIH